MARSCRKTLPCLDTTRETRARSKRNRAAASGFSQARVQAMGSMMRVLGIETTCDETAAAVVRLRPDGSGEILADEVMSQIAVHAPFGGVVPEIAARAHVEIIDLLIARALTRAKVAAKDLDGVAAAAGPGRVRRGPFGPDGCPGRAGGAR